MKAKLIGRQNIKFVAENGNQIDGTKLHLAFLDDAVQEGMMVNSYFINANSGINLPANLAINTDIELTFNHRGKLTGVSLASPIGK
jgi:hypothetical protein